jgi:hypothetical protein
MYVLIVSVIVLWALFLLWTGFMNLYCTVRFTQQSRLAEERWQRQRIQPSTA